jgi:hypothetical protein
MSSFRLVNSDSYTRSSTFRAAAYRAGRSRLHHARRRDQQGDHARGDP